MRKEKRHIWLLGISVIALAGFLYLFFSYSPTFFITLGGLALFSLFLWGLIKYIFADTTQATLISIMISSYLLVRTLGLKDLVFAILFLILFVTLELFFKRS